MSKTVIFNNQVYKLDENKLAPINTSIVEFLTTELSGTGATIKFNNTTYEVDGAKLSTSKSELVNFLGTIQGEGEVVEIDGVEYSVDSSALEEATATVAETLVNLSVFSEGLAYELNADGVSYSVAGIGTCTDTDLVIPGEYDGLPVTSIGYAAFFLRTGLTSVTIPDSITSIGDAAFNYCSKLTRVTIGNGVTSIGSSAFSGCTSLTSVTIPDSVTSIGYSAFEDCHSLESVYYDGDIASWCNISFGDSIANPVYYAKKLYIKKSGTNEYELLTNNLVIPDSVTEIKPYAFASYDSLTSVTIPDSVTSIGRYAFRNCDSLTSVTIGNGITSIYSSAFNGCTNLTDIYINKDTDSIADSPWGAEDYAIVHWNSTGPDAA